MADAKSTSKRSFEKDPEERTPRENAAHTLAHQLRTGDAVEAAAFDALAAELPDMLKAAGVELQRSGADYIALKWCSTCLHGSHAAGECTGRDPGVVVGIGFRRTCNCESTP